jgi:hypothetical protein
MDEKKPRRKKTGGRKPGSLNRKTIIGKNISDTLKAWIGLDDESVARTGMIDGEGYRGRLALREMWNDQRPVDPQFVALAKFLFSYAYGLPTKVVEHKEQRLQLTFATTHGYLPYDSRAPAAIEMNKRSAALNAAKDQELLQALEAKGEVIEVEKTADTEVLESVDPDAFGGGGSKR